MVRENLIKLNNSVELYWVNYRICISQHSLLQSNKAFAITSISMLCLDAQRYNYAKFKIIR